ncbi:4Fe-4S dicluster domain-containing protein [Clostridium chrysemydis]|uniref:4Fe-4S dicluster domain-containing protein n=1 Tax=Clostridium chrysemydis TaxID=2665504 RepID=UPI003F3918E6
MFHFETQLSKLKHEVLAEVARLSKDGDLTKEEIEGIPYKIITGDKPIYRCCIYKERAIVLERAKLAGGFMSNGDVADCELIDISPDEQIIYIIEAACDRCPINRYSVTDSCRNCIAHRCKEACNFGAISIVNGRAYINQEICKECGMCKKACPYDAISEVMRPCKIACPTGALDIGIEDRRAVIKSDLCVNCGGCMKACPFGAISDKSFIVPVSKILSKKEEVYAIVAPAITGQFGNKVTYGQIKNAIKKLGFKDMVEAACGADLVTINECKEFKERMENGEKYMTNSCCRAFVEYVEKKYNTEKDKISNTVSPMIATGKVLKHKYKECKTVFIGPCTAKKSEGIKFGKDSIDYVITFEELFALLDAFEIDIESLEDDIVEDGTIFGRNFGMSGGVSSAIENYIKENNLEIDFTPVKVSGGIELKKTLAMAKLGKLNGNFIEGMMCEGGCINGAGVIVQSNRAKASFIKLNKVNPKEKVSEVDGIDLEKEKD